MRKLNERGWGLGEMILLLCIFAIAIIIIVIQAHNMGIDGSDEPVRTPLPLSGAVVNYIVR